MNGYTYIASTGQNTIALTPTNNTLNINGQGAIVVTTNTSSNTLNINLNTSNLTVPNFSVTGTLVLNPSIAGTLDNITIGSISPAPATFTTLAVTSTATLSPANANVTISPTGTGTVVINPATAGSINNMSIGATTPSTGNFTSITLAGTQPTSISSVVTKGYVAALSAAYGVALS